jgi:hypothetical protein
LLLATKFPLIFPCESLINVPPLLNTYPNLRVSPIEHRIMDSDVEMPEQKSAPALVTSVSLPVLSPSDSQQVSPIAPDIDDSPSAGLDDPSPSDVVPKISTDSKGKGKPASGKPKSTKPRARSPSPSPPPPAPPPPLRTIRLEIQLGGPENYEVDMAALAKATGQRPASPPAAAAAVAVAKRYESESDGEGAPESGMGTDGGGDKKAKKVRNAYMR